MSRKDIYDENKRLKAELTRMQEQLSGNFYERERAKDADMAFAASCVMAFLHGTARLVCAPGGPNGEFVVRFEP